MDIVDGRSAEKALADARGARALGARRAARPSWYYPALGLSLFVGLSSFSVGMPAIGVPLGLVLGPVALEMMARQQAGAAPLQDYFHTSVRGLAIGYAALVATLAGLGIVLEKVSELTGAATVCGVVVLVVTVLVGRRLDSRRAAGQASYDLS